MSEFQLFNKALDAYENRSSNDKSSSSEEDLSCIHDKIFVDKGVTICTDCGEEIDRKISHNKEWRYYGPSDTKRVSDPNHARLRKSEERSIFKDVENLNFSESIVAKANKIYTEVTKGKIFRGDSRKSIVFACIFHAFKLSGNPLSHDNLIKIFKMDRKTGLRGIKYVSLNAPKISNIRTTHITPKILVSETMDKFDATDAQKEEVKKLYEQIRNKSSRLNRSRPQSVAAGLTFYWISLKNLSRNKGEKDPNAPKKNISLKDFTKNVQLSELTISKIAKEISKVLNTPEVI